MCKILRPYQESAIASLWDFLFNRKGNPLIVAPVGSGKTLLIAEFIKRISQQYPRTRIVVLTHVKELLQQGMDQLLEQYRDCNAGFYCASLGEKRLYNDITLASIQSIHNKVGRFNRCPEIIIIDEAHLISNNDKTQYRKFINNVHSINPNCKVIGFTGSPFRSDTGNLCDGEGRLFDDVAYEISIDFMIKEGYWAKPVTPESITTKMDVSGVHKRRGDYIPSELERAVNVDSITEGCVAETIEKAAIHKRKKWLVFAAGLDHCKNVRDCFRANGILCEMVTSKTPKVERDSIIKKFRNGDIKCLVNVAVLTTGFDVPDIDLLVFMRPTKSVVLYIQIAGRGVRPVYKEGCDLSTKTGRLHAIEYGPKPNCLFLDFAGIVADLGPLDEIEIRRPIKKEKKDKEPAEKSISVKRCPSCGTICNAAQKNCFNCSYLFTIQNLKTTASNAAIISTDSRPEWLVVTNVAYTVHRKLGNKMAPKTLKVKYSTYKGAYYEWICFEHNVFPVGSNKRFAWDNALKWHNNRRPDMPPPCSIKEALMLQYPEPKEICVQKQKGFFKVIDFKF